MAGVADSAIARFDELTMPDDDDEVEANRERNGGMEPGDGVPVLRRRVQTLERPIRPHPRVDARDPGSTHARLDARRRSRHRLDPGAPDPDHQPRAHDPGLDPDRPTHGRTGRPGHAPRRRSPTPSRSRRPPPSTSSTTPRRAT
jgi:hypothetical protein